MKELLSFRKSGVFATFILTSSLALASGEGRNGPDQHGISIPVTSDQFVKASEMKAAIITCQQSQQNILLAQILRQEIDFKVNSFGEILLYIQDKKNASNSLQILINANVAAVYTESSVKTNSAGNKFQAQSYFPSMLTMIIIPKGNPTYDVYHRQFQSNRRKNVNVAYADSALIDTLKESKEMWIRFVGGITVNSELLETTKPDSLGFKKESDRLVTNIQVVRRPIMNGETNQPTELEDDLNGFNQCLFNELNK